MSESNRTSISLSRMRRWLYTAVVSDAVDALGYTNQCPRAPIRPVTGFSLLVGRCKTTRWADIYHEDPDTYEMELQAVDSCQPDEVVICAAGGSMRSGIWGELLSPAARNSGCVGAIVDGAVRDTLKMTSMGFPVWARGTVPYDSMNRQMVIHMDVPVEVGGVICHPGDLIFADGDGLCVVPQEVEAEAIQAAWDKVHAENEVREAIKGGMKAVEAYHRYGVL